MRLFRDCSLRLASLSSLLGASPGLFIHASAFHVLFTQRAPTANGHNRTFVQPAIFDALGSLHPVISQTRIRNLHSTPQSSSHRNASPSAFTRPTDGRLKCVPSTLRPLASRFNGFVPVFSRSYPRSHGSSRPSRPRRMLMALKMEGQWIDGVVFEVSK